MRYRAMRGTKDILPEATAQWRHLEDLFRRVTTRFGYGEIRTPIFEARDLFIHGTGESTEVVTKEMYEFQDKKGRWLSLRPEGTPPVVRAYLEHSLARHGLPVKLFYQGPMFRYDRPGAGRFRQFHQVGVEAIGSASALLDAEIISLLHEYLTELGLTELETHVNSLGCPACRPAYREKLETFLAPLAERLCEDCQVRLVKNPLRILDCKVKSCRELLTDSPVPLEVICEQCRIHLSEVESQLRSWRIPYRLEPRLVRGLDYYTRTVFETFVPEVSRENALGGGGRYDGLVEICGGPPTPATGFSAGLERIHEAMEATGAYLPELPPTEVYLAVQHQQYRDEAALFLAELRGSFVAEIDYDGRSLKSQLKDANRRRARYVVIFAEDEIAKGELRVRNMEAGEEENVPRERVMAWLHERLRP